MAMYEKINSEKEYVRIAITLSRLYGIGETLHPWKYIENEKFCRDNKKMDRWIFAYGRWRKRYFETLWI